MSHKFGRPPPPPTSSQVSQTPPPLKPRNTNLAFTSKTIQPIRGPSVSFRLFDPGGGGGWKVQEFETGKGQDLYRPVLLNLGATAH